MSELLEFLNRCLDEVQCIAEAAHSGPWRWNYTEAFQGDVPPWAELESGEDTVIACEGQLVMFGTADAEHIALHDPRSVLAVVEAQGAILAIHAPFTCPDAFSACSSCEDGKQGDIEWPCPTVRALASAYRHHPGYLPEWAPT